MHIQKLLTAKGGIQSIAFGRHCFSSLRLIRILQSRFQLRAAGRLGWFLFKSPLRLIYQDQEYLVMYEVYLYSISPRGKPSDATTEFLQSVAEFLEYQKIPAWRAWLAAADERRFGKGLGEMVAGRGQRAGRKYATGPYGMKAWLAGKGKDNAPAGLKPVGLLGKVVFVAVIVALFAAIPCGLLANFTPAVKWTAAAVVCGSDENVVIQFERKSNLSNRSAGRPRMHGTRAIVRCGTPQGQISENKYWEVVGVIYAACYPVVLVGLALWLRRLKVRDRRH